MKNVLFPGIHTHGYIAEYEFSRHDEFLALRLQQQSFATLIEAV